MGSPVLGAVVGYRIDDGDAAVIRQRRTASDRRGAPVHVGELVPLVVTQVVDNARVNGQALLDGDDSLWVTYAEHGASPGQWSPLAS